MRNNPDESDTGDGVYHSLQGAPMYLMDIGAPSYFGPAPRSYPSAAPPGLSAGLRENEFARAFPSCGRAPCRILSLMPERLTPEALTSFLASFSPEAQMLARAARRRLLDIFPDAIETAEGK